MRAHRRGCQKRLRMVLHQAIDDCGVTGIAAEIAVPLALEDYADVWHGARAAKWIEDYSRRAPFFLWVGITGPHDPWDALASLPTVSIGSSKPYETSSSRIAETFFS